MRGHLGFPIKPTPPPPYTPVAVVLTSGSSYTVPSGATYVKAWAVGAGGSGGPGGAGGVAYKTWATNGGATLSYSVSDTASSNTTVTLSGTTITGYGGAAGTGGYPGAGGAFAGGDGGATGGNGWQGTYDDTDHYYGGSINGTGIDYSTVGSVNIVGSSVSGLIDAVTLSGFSVFYGSSYFGSGAARFWFYGGSISYYANRGGGGVDNVWTHGGGAVVFYFT